MTRLEQREHALEKQALSSLSEASAPKPCRKKRGLAANPRVSFSQSEPLPPTPPEAHHQISFSWNNHLDIPTWLSANTGDPAIKGFLPKLKDHLLDPFPPSLAHAEDEVDDWQYYYVDIFVDRDMYMCYAGGGVGHYKVALPEEAGEDPLDEFEVAYDTVIEEPGVGQVSVSNEDEAPCKDSDLDGEGSDSGDDDDDVERGDAGSDEDLGPEDGEGGIDEEDELGYAPL
ncbi:hypothetical protein DXG01_010068 [Tephrocybe rancida]|nr:hypothetical protein DXG01_010068 [Tephrocybe rancida]